MVPQIKTEFCISSSKVFPEEVTNLLGISPTRTWHIGENIQGTFLKRKHHGWCLSTDIEKKLDVSESIRSLFQILLPKSETITYICTQHDLEVEVSCVIYIVDETPAINLDQEIISKLAELNATIDIDIILTE